MEDRLKWLLKEEGVYFSRVMIGARVSEPHSSESNWDFSYIIIYFFSCVRRSIYAQCCHLTR